jgi:serine/threonine protein kinase
MTTVMAPTRVTTTNRNGRATFTMSPLERYQLVAKIGQGSFGVVSEFLDVVRGYVPVAIKEVTIRDEFEREVSILRDLGANQYVIGLLNSFENAGKFYIVMPKADVTLGRYILKNRLDTDTVMHIVMQIAYGLHGLHHLGWIHADLKPENIVVTSTRLGFPRVQIIDFGSCFRTAASTTTTTTTTAASSTTDKPSDFPEEDAYVTTRWYRSPEVVVGRPNAVDKPIDIWALGCIAAQMLTGLVTFPADDEPELIGMIEAFCGPFDLGFVESSPYKNDIFYNQASSKDPPRGPSFAQNAHVYGRWFDRLERSLVVPVAWEDAPFITKSRQTKTGIYAGDVSDALLRMRVDMSTFLGLQQDVVTGSRLLHVVSSMLAVDPGQRIDIDGLISSFV